MKTEELRKLRNAAGLTQAQLGRKACLSCSAIAHYETGRKTPRVGSLQRLAAALGCEVAALL